MTGAVRVGQRLCPRPLGGLFVAFAWLGMAGAVGPSPGFNSAPGSSHYAAFSVLVPGGSLVPTLGTLSKSPANPLIRGDNPWEHNIDNGYSNVLHDPEDSFGLGAYRVYYRYDRHAYDDPHVLIATHAALLPQRRRILPRCHPRRVQRIGHTLCHEPRRRVVHQAAPRPLPVRSREFHRKQYPV